MTGRFYAGVSVQNHRAVNMDGLALKCRKIGTEDVTLAVVCDGVGSTEDGAYAASRCIQLIAEWFDAVDSPDRLGLTARDVILEINEKVSTEASLNGLNTATTMSVLLLMGTYYYVLHVGDSRIYSYSNGYLSQLTQDQITDTGKLRSCVGHGQQIIPYYDEGSADAELFLICSDGLYKKVENEQISLLISDVTAKNVEKKVKTLVDCAIQRGEKDNISVALIGRKK